jgi:AraC-like DNA-binding protein
LFLFCCNTFSSNDTIYIPFSSRQIHIDGDLSEWKTFYKTTFRDTSGRIHPSGDYLLSDVNPPDFREDLIPLPKSRNNVLTMLCWDYEALYVGFVVVDNHFVAEFTGMPDNPNIFLNDGVEVYIDTGNDSENRMDINDYQFIIDIMNQKCIFRGDLRLMKEDTLVVPKERGQNVIIESAVSTFGTINDEQEDRYYIVEMKIPFLAIGMKVSQGQIVKIDICNNDSDWLISELQVTKEQLYYTWPFNWSGIGDFGFPQTWKTAKLVGKPSLFNVLSEKFKYSWIYFFGVFVALVLVVFTVLYFKIRKLRRLPDKEIVKKYIILSNMDEQQSEDDNENILLTKVSQYIYDNISDKITPQNVADNINMSLRSLQRLTKNELDCTPVALIQSVKLQYAMHLLQKDKKLNVSDVAYDSGFSDPAYFSKLFKNHFGISPKQIIAGETPNNKKNNL